MARVLLEHLAIENTVYLSYHMNMTCKCHIDSLYLLTFCIEISVARRTVVHLDCSICNEDMYA